MCILGVNNANTTIDNKGSNLLAGQRMRMCWLGIRILASRLDGLYRSMSEDKNNYFTINRSLLSRKDWLSEKFTRSQAWIDIIGHARWKPGTERISGRRIELKRGQLCWSILNLSKRWRWSREKVKRYLCELEIDHQISHQNIVVTTLITILNYDQYQLAPTPDKSPNESPDKSPEPTPDKSPDKSRKNKVKKENKAKKENTGRCESLEIWLEYANEQGFPKQPATGAFDHYEAVGWRQGRGTGKPLKDWRAALRTAFRNDKEWHPENYKKENPADHILDIKYHKALKRAMDELNLFTEEFYQKCIDDKRKIDTQLGNRMNELQSSK